MKNGVLKKCDDSAPLRDDKNAEESGHRYHDYDDLDTGWAWVVMIASFGAFCIIGGMMYAVGIIHATLLDKYQERVTLTSWAGSLHSALVIAAGPLSSVLIDRFSCRVAIMTSGLFFVTGYLSTAFAPTIEVAIFTCGVVAGLGGAFGYTASMVVVGFNFRRFRNVSLGFAVSGVGVGLFVMAPVMQMCKDHFGNSGFFIILAAMAANLVTFGAVCFPSKLETATKRERKLEAEKLKEFESTSCASLRNYGRVATNKAILCLCLSMFNFCLGVNLVYLHLPTHMLQQGFSSTQASYVISISGIMSVIGRFCTGVVANLEKMDDTILYSGPMGFVAAATFLYPFYSATFTGQVIYAVTLGLFFGSCTVVTASVTIKHVGVNFMSAAIGLEFFFAGIGAAIGPVLAGLIVDEGGTYDHSFYIAGSCIFLASLSSAVTMYMGDGSCNNKEELITKVSVGEYESKIGTDIAFLKADVCND